MLNFSVGPVMTWEEILNIGGRQVPYFRTSEFSSIMLESENYMNEFANAPAGSRTVFLTGSGTMAMESVIMNILTTNDKVLVVNGGSFGKRFVELCGIHKIPFDEISLSMGETLTKKILDQYNSLDYTAFLVNIHETSTGVLYDMNLIHEFCKSGKLLLIADAISTFLADPIDMTEMGIDVMITSSQKALACAPGISMITMTDVAMDRVYSNGTKCLYMDIIGALKNGDRGQTPFTPAVATLIQINRRLKMIAEKGGVCSEIERVSDIANYFRSEIIKLPFEFVSKSPSNAVTSLHPTNNVSAKAIFETLKDNYGIWVCPNGGEWSDYMFRVGHIGNITNEDINTLVNAMKKLF